MKQVLQHARTGEISVMEVPEPKLLPACLLVKIAASLVSAGTERASSEFASKSLLQKAKARPDLVREVIAKVHRDGILSAVSAVRSRLDQPSALGYSSAGIVIGVGKGVSDMIVGDRVACAGAGYATHAETACVPRLLAARIESNDVSFEEAAFTTVGAVALHGVRTAQVNIGDVVGVIGLGLVGQLTVQILKAAGCLVMGMDLVPARVKLASDLGMDAGSSSAEEFEDLCGQISSGHGMDAVLITAETSSSAPVELAGRIVRDRGTVVAVGTVGMDIPRKDYYGKEVQFRVSRSYGPGRYDAAFEQKGRDYPIGYVRWTETRNMESFLTLLSQQKVTMTPLITHRIPIEKATRAYDVITGKSGEPYLGVVITYPEHRAEMPRLHLAEAGKRSTAREGTVSIGLLGTGSFATSTLLPAMKQVEGITLIRACAATGSHARHAADRFGFRYCCTDDAQLLADSDVNTVVIATRHHLHAQQVIAGLAAGKNVFCEKPLCLSKSELQEIALAYSQSNQRLMVGYNRRFAPLATRMKDFVEKMNGPLALHYRVNAGALPADHWVNDPEQGGGRIIGEVCHFVDFLTFLVGEPAVEVHTRTLDGSAENVILSLQFPNGSQGTISYLANGDRSFSKERVEVFGATAVAVLEDFRRLELVRNGKRQVFRSRLRQDKGHRGEWQAFVDALRRGGPSPIPFADILPTTLTTFCAMESLASGQSVKVDLDSLDS
jgi:predicted dehydrogenase/threonine dehydrogenase-like Zn-dependent dehydrogenase